MPDREYMTVNARHTDGVFRIVSVNDNEAPTEKQGLPMTDHLAALAEQGWEIVNMTDLSVQGTLQVKVLLKRRAA